MDIKRNLPKNYEFFWTQFDATGNLCLRLITKESLPPHVTVDGVHITLQLRAPASPSFPIFVWETPMPLGGVIEIEEMRVSLPLSFKKIAFIGDTGCRPMQGCSIEKWPFSKIANKLVEEGPDLIIHLGDYIYRHLAAQKRYGLSVIHLEEGDNWSGWQKEFFSPLHDMLPAVPWIFVRGNQECCQAACEGWFRFLDGYPYRPVPSNYTPAYVIPLEKVNLIVHDSSCVEPEHEKDWPDKQLQHLNLSPDKDAWLLTHRPPWGIVNCQKNNDNKPLIIMNERSNLQSFLEPFPDSLTTIFSGHIHAFQAIKLAQNNIQLFVIGNGGVNLEKARPPKILKNTRLEDKKIDYAVSLIESGYGIAQYASQKWSLQAKNSQGQSLIELDCKNTG